MGCDPMPVTDLSTFYSNKTAPVNIMSATFLSVGRPDYAKEVFRAAVNAHPKMRSEIVSILGDLYYKPLETEDCLKTQIVELPDNHIKNMDDLGDFIGEHMQTFLPFDRP